MSDKGRRWTKKSAGAKERDGIRIHPKRGKTGAIWLIFPRFYDSCGEKRGIPSQLCTDSRIEQVSSPFSASMTTVPPPATAPSRIVRAISVSAFACR